MGKAEIVGNCAIARNSNLATASTTDRPATCWFEYIEVRGALRQPLERGIYLGM